jgi:hypothetical protein
MTRTTHPSRRLAVFLMMGLGLVGPVATGLCDWPMFRHDAARSGHADGPAPQLTRIAWSADLGGPVDSSPAIAEGLVVAGTARGTFHALDVATGTAKWDVDIGNPMVSSPCVDSGRVFVGCVDGYLYALELSTGKQLWRARTGRSVTASPLTIGNRAICGSTDGRLYAFSVSDGQRIWKTEPGGEIHAGAAANSAVVVYGDWDHRVRCVRVEDGSAVWPEPYVAEGPIVASPVIEGAHCVISTISPTGIQPPHSLNTHCLDLATGKRLWGQSGKNPWQTDKEGQMSVSTSPTIVGEDVWFMTMEGYGNWNAVVRSAKLESGARGADIRQHSRGKLAISDSSPALAGNLLYFADYAAFAYQIDTNTRRPLNVLPLGAKTASSPAISDGRLYIGLTDGKLLCIE